MPRPVGLIEPVFIVMAMVWTTNFVYLEVERLHRGTEESFMLIFIVPLMLPEVVSRAFPDLP